MRHLNDKIRVCVVCPVEFYGEKILLRGCSSKEGRSVFSFISVFDDRKAGSIKKIKWAGNRILEAKKQNKNGKNGR